VFCMKVGLRSLIEGLAYAIQGSVTTLAFVHNITKPKIQAGKFTTVMSAMGS
jgi:hypothetical protein